MFQQEIQSKTVLTDSVRKAKVSRIAASIEAAVKSAETTLKSPEATKQMPSQSTQSLPDIQSKPKLITQKLPSTKSYAQAETAVINYNFHSNLSLFHTVQNSKVMMILQKVIYFYLLFITTFCKNFPEIGFYVYFQVKFSSKFLNHLQMSNV